MKVVNLSRDELVEVPDPRMKGFGLARTWLEADAAITLPVLKTHATTVFTGAIKNQWGCVPGSTASCCTSTCTNWSAT